MAEPETRDYAFGAAWMKDLITVYGRTWGDLAIGWKGMLDRMQHDNYTPGKYISDVAGLWDQWVRNVMLLGYPAGRWLQGGDQISTLFFVVDADGGYGNAKLAPIPYGVDPALELDPIVLQSATGKHQEKKRVVAGITSDGSQLRVQLQDARQIRAGDYASMVTVTKDGRPAALCQLVVRKLGKSASLPAAPRTGSGRRKKKMRASARTPPA